MWVTLEGGEWLALGVHNLDGGDVALRVLLGCIMEGGAAADLQVV